MHSISIPCPLTREAVIFNVPCPLTWALFFSNDPCPLTWEAIKLNVPCPLTQAMFFSNGPCPLTWEAIIFSSLCYNVYAVTKLYEIFRRNLSLALHPNQILTLTIVTNQFVHTL